MNKQVISKVLLDGNNWCEINEESKIPQDVPVIIRLEDRRIILAKSKDSVLYSEDIKVAKYNSDGTWKIMGPHPLYDFSPLSNKCTINDGVKVTHWRYPVNNEEEAWSKRLLPCNIYKNLKLEVDDEHRKDVYLALIHSAALMAQVFGSEAIENKYEDEPEDTDEEKDYKSRMRQAKKDYSILCDLQSAMDDPSSTTTIRPGSVIDKMKESDDALTQFILSSKCAFSPSTKAEIYSELSEILEIVSRGQSLIRTFLECVDDKTSTLKKPDYDGDTELLFTEEGNDNAMDKE